MKVVVTGASGMLGNAVLRELLLREEEVQGWSRSVRATPEGVALFRIDLRDAGRVGRVLFGLNPEVVINCAALTDADFCEDNPHIAQIVNALVPESLAQSASKIGARYIHISTDAVYGGEKEGRRSESDQPKPASVYAMTKLEGERRILAVYPEALVVRTTMFGWTLPTAPRPKFAEQILAALTDYRKIQLWSDAYFSPLHVGYLTDALLALTEKDTSGVLNIGAEAPISKVNFGREIAKVFGLDPALIEEALVDEAELRAKRPKNVGLNIGRYERLVNGDTRSVENGIERLYRETFNGEAKKIRGRETYP